MHMDAYAIRYDFNCLVHIIWQHNDSKVSCPLTLLFFPMMHRYFPYRVILFCPMRLDVSKLKLQHQQFSSEVQRENCTVFRDMMCILLHLIILVSHLAVNKFLMRMTKEVLEKSTINLLTETYLSDSSSTARKKNLQNGPEQTMKYAV